MPAVAYLECSRCKYQVSPETPHAACPMDGGSLYVRYDMEVLKRTARREEIAVRAAASPASPGMWRYSAVLPDIEPVTLGEGWTPMVQSRQYPGLLVKEEGANPAGTYKARGMSLAVSMAKHHGVRHLTLASAGNTAGALAAYSAAAGISAHIFMPQDVVFANYVEAVLYGADVTVVDGVISESARMLGERMASQKASITDRDQVWFDISPSTDPFQVEGEKTLGYELVEQLGWVYPDAVVFSAEEGGGLIGMWKAFEEMEQLGWVSGKRPKMYAAGAVPTIRAEDRRQLREGFQDVAPSAAGARGPQPCWDSMILEICKVSGGGLVEAAGDEILQSLLDWAKHEGLFLSPEGAAAASAYKRLLAKGDLKREDRVVLFNTGAGLKYTDPTAAAMHLRRPGALPKSLPVGGIITPV